MILGDFNAHVGYQDLLPAERSRVGSLLYHPLSNPNGETLKELLLFHNLRLCSSFGPDRSVLCTWSRGQSRSQIDHIVMPIIPQFLRPECRCLEIGGRFSDHRLLTLRVKHRPETREAAPTIPSQRRPDAEPIKLSLLTTDPVVKRNYHRELAQRLTTPPPGRDMTNPTHRLEHINNAVTGAANATLCTPRSPPTPKRKQAGRHLERLEKELFADRHDPRKRRQVKEAKQAKRLAYQEHQDKKVHDFFENLESYPILDRIRMTYRYVRQHRRKANQKNRRYIPIRAWEDKLRSGSSSSEIPLLTETEGPPEDSGPSRMDVERLVHLLRNNTAAGTNRIRPELLRYGNIELHTEIHGFFRIVWERNQVPEELIETVQIPVPKTARPTGTDEYRRITLCQTIYKVYSRYLLECLESHLGEVPNYQYAYHQNRSAEDQVFIEGGKQHW